MPDPIEHRFYGELAEWWPLISPSDEYAEEAAFAAGLLASATVPVADVLELGSGGGTYSSYLGGSGGGAVILDIAGTLTVDGTVSANGGDGITRG